MRTMQIMSTMAYLCTHVNGCDERDLNSKCRLMREWSNWDPHALLAST